MLDALAPAADRIMIHFKASISGGENIDLRVLIPTKITTEYKPVVGHQSRQYLFENRKTGMMRNTTKGHCGFILRRIYAHKRGEPAAITKGIIEGIYRL
jgi:hypothetical protein